MNFDSFNLDPILTKTVQAANYTEPTPIQSAAIPVVMQGTDVMGLAQTGTGKTAAFVLPILNRLLQNGHGGKVRALVLAPTRELAVQIEGVFRQFSARTRLTSTCIFGGVAYGSQHAAIRRRPDVIVACPGRLLDHLQQKTIDLSGIEVLVLDEADQMFDMGFLPSIRKIIHLLPKTRQSLLFSATMPTEIRSLAEEVLTNPEIIQADNVKTASTVSHSLMFAPTEQDKAGMLLSVLEKKQTDSVLVFMRTKHRVKRLAEQLHSKGFHVTSLQGNLSQSKRQQAITGFRSGKYKILVATDIAARGIDVASVSHVINYDVPTTPEAYTHRIGRTGRALKTGDALTFVTREDGSTVRAIERFIGSKIARELVADGSDNFPELYADSQQQQGGRPGFSSRRRGPQGSPQGRGQRRGPGRNPYSRTPSDRPQRY